MEQGIIRTTAEVVEVEGARDVYGEFLDSLDTSARTKDTYGKALKRWAAWLDSDAMGCFDARREDVIRYRDSMAAEGLKASTVNTYLTAVRCFYRWTDSIGRYPNIAAGVRGLKQSGAGAKDSLTVEQARRVLDEDTGTLKAKRDHAMVNLMLRRGLRTIEVARADIGDIQQMGGQVVLFIQGKGYSDKGAFVVLSDEVLQPIYDYLDARGVDDPSAPLFASLSNRNMGGRMSTRSVSRVVKERMKACGLSSARLTAHSLRHTAVTFALLSGASLQETQAMARHASIETTLIYAHNLQRLDARAERGVDDYIRTGAVGRRAA